MGQWMSLVGDLIKELINYYSIFLKLEYFLIYYVDRWISFCLSDRILFE